MDNVHGANWDGWDPPETHECPVCDGPTEELGVPCDYCLEAEDYDMNQTTMEFYISYLKLVKMKMSEEVLEAMRQRMIDWNDEKPFDVIERACELELKKQEASAG
jgi:hypothetical protein